MKIYQFVKDPGRRKKLEQLSANAPGDQNQAHTTRKSLRMYLMNLKKKQRKEEETYRTFSGYT